MIGKSILRVNTCDFIDEKFKRLQDELLDNENIIDNILRIPYTHKLVKDGIINVEKYEFLGSKVVASKHKDDIYFGHCYGCPDKCGINI